MQKSMKFDHAVCLSTATICFETMVHVGRLTTYDRRARKSVCLEYYPITYGDHKYVQ